ncbi:MAG: F0F1 ATP synthase subunit epsilon [Chromatiales bacterium]|jgi:F-type H+-transporting ATPase subunit epsilon|nr:F0F1 ATP synthase subunit epsilon [Chromatiales bacterium]MDP6150202.1 F0F1 ATP synthase subunit epsilon [Gammaproteobacteria bacterium]MDP7270950.1 F0F1 ATP synthase subunit epsilon [Gammaproteobacteria bacterium]HJP05423.1 F0F1 ATP synthase subunit epsilon [Gammaproteobacteria bacterium]
MATLHVDIVSAEGEIFSGEAAMVFAPAKMGDVGIAPRHAPLLTDLRPGDLRVQTPEGEEKFFFVTGGVLEVQPHMVTVLADSAMHGDDLDEEAAKAAQEAAEQMLAGATEKQDLEHARMQLVEAAARYKAVQKLKGRKG